MLESPTDPVRYWLEYDTDTLLPWCCEGCFARLGKYRLRGVMEGAPTYYCLACGQETLRLLTEDRP